MTSISGTVGAYGVSSPYVPSSEERSVAADDQSGSFEQQMAQEAPASEASVEPQRPRSQLQELLARGPIPAGIGIDVTWTAMLCRQNPRELEAAQQAAAAAGRPIPQMEYDMYLPDISTLSLERAQEIYDTATSLRFDKKDSTTFHIGKRGEGGPTTTIEAYIASLKDFIDSDGTVVPDAADPLERHRDLPRIEDSTWMMTGRRLDPVPGEEGPGALETHMWFPEIADMGLERGQVVYDTLAKMSAEDRASRQFHYGFPGPGRKLDTVPLMSADDYQAAVKAYLDSDGTAVQDVPTAPSEPWGDDFKPSAEFLEWQTAREAAMAPLRAWMEDPRNAPPGFDFAAHRQAWLEEFGTYRPKELPV